MSEPEKIARELISTYPGEQILMMGHQRDEDHPKPTDPTMSEATEGHCGVCNAPVWSTEVKDTVMQLAPGSVIACHTCINLIMKAGAVKEAALVTKTDNHER